MIRFVPACEREIKAFPIDVREQLADALARLDEGHTLSMPLSRPLPSLGPRVHELRFRDRNGIFRVIYAVIAKQDVLVVHGFQKKTERIPRNTIELVLKRIRDNMR